MNCVATEEEKEEEKEKGVGKNHSELCGPKSDRRCLPRYLRLTPHNQRRKVQNRIYINYDVIETHCSLVASLYSDA